MDVRSSVATDRIVARHRTQALGTDVSFCLSPPARLPRRQISEALGAAVAELRAVEAALSPLHPRSLVNAVRRGELVPDAYPPPLAAIVAQCAVMRARTDGWFDAWAVPGGFDPSGLVRGWAVDRAAALLRQAGIENFAIRAGADRLVRGPAPVGGAWRVGIADPADPERPAAVVELVDGALAVSGSAPDPRTRAPGGEVRAGSALERIIDPHTGGPARAHGPAAVSGPELSVANAYAVALCAAGEAGFAWFPTPEGYRVLLVDGAPAPPRARLSPQLRRVPLTASAPS